MELIMALVHYFSIVCTDGDWLSGVRWLIVRHAKGCTDLCSDRGGWVCGWLRLAASPASLRNGGN
jgi:hypothetical protein